MTITYYGVFCETSAGIHKKTLANKSISKKGFALLFCLYRVSFKKSFSMFVFFGQQLSYVLELKKDNLPLTTL